MKAIGIFFTGMMVALVAVMLPFALHPAFASDNGHIEALVPAESGQLETGGSDAHWVTLAPLERGSDDARVEALLPAESSEVVETGAGEGAHVLMNPSVRGHDTARIEQLLPAESAE